MRAGLPKREPGWLDRWERIGVYDRLREKAPGGRPSSCMTARPMPTAISISATR
jgi:isoleucyl-tRNA synthetase